jgi:hypothetical protein
MRRNNMYYCIIKDGALRIVNKEFYDEHRKELVALAVGTLEEIYNYLDDLGVLIEGDADDELE